MAYKRDGSAKCGEPGGYNKHMKKMRQHPKGILSWVFAPCEACKTARADAMRDWRKRRYLAKSSLMVEPTGTRRRLQALQALGWSMRVIAERCDMLDINLYAIARGRGKKVYLTTHQAVKKAYEEMSMTTAPNTRDNRVVRTYARKNGYVPPLAWDDDEIDDPNALPSGVNRNVMFRWLRHCATPDERQRYEEMTMAEQQSA